MKQEKHRNRNVLIVNAYSAKNIGDGAIIVASVKLLRKLLPDCRVQVMSSYEEDNIQLYRSVDAESVSSVWKLGHDRSRLARYLEGPKSFIRVLLRGKVRNQEMVKKADVVISAGGGYLFSSRKGPLGAGFVNALFHIWLATFHKKPTLIFPKSIGPLHSKADKILLRQVLSRCSVVFVREPISTKLVKQLGLTNSVQCPDIAFSLLPAEVDARQYKVDVGTPKIGITVLDWQFFRRGTTKDDVTRYLDCVVQACVNLKQEHHQAHFYVFVQVAVSQEFGADSDLSISKRLQERLGEVATLVVLDPDMGPERVIGLYGHMDLFLASRMHSAIFALCASVPTIALVYQEKTKGTFEMLGLSHYAFDVQQVQAQQLGETAHAILQDTEKVRAQTKEAVDKARQQIESEVTLSLKKSKVL